MRRETLVSIRIMRNGKFKTLHAVRTKAVGPSRIQISVFKAPNLRPKANVPKDTKANTWLRIP